MLSSVKVTITRHQTCHNRSDEQKQRAGFGYDLCRAKAEALIETVQLGRFIAGCCPNQDVFTHPDIALRGEARTVAELTGGIRIKIARPQRLFQGNPMRPKGAYFAQDERDIDRLKCVF